MRRVLRVAAVAAGVLAALTAWDWAERRIPEGTRWVSVGKVMKTMLMNLVTLMVVRERADVVEVEGVLAGVVGDVLLRPSGRLGEPGRGPLVVETPGGQVRIALPPATSRPPAAAGRPATSRPPASVSATMVAVMAG